MTGKEKITEENLSEQRLQWFDRVKRIHDKRVPVKAKKLYFMAEIEADLSRDTMRL